MVGFLAAGTHQPLVALEYFTRAVEVLDWGSREWKDVSKDDRGAIFEWTFIRGVKRHWLTTMHQVSDLLHIDPHLHCN